jgi:hypothetical protein
VCQATVVRSCLLRVLCSCRHHCHQPLLLLLLGLTAQHLGSKACICVQQSEYIWAARHAYACNSQNTGLGGSHEPFTLHPHLCCTAPFTACRLYELYCDYVLKNPFYEIEQVIKCELFDANVEALLKRYPAM